MSKQEVYLKLYKQLLANTFFELSLLKRYEWGTEEYAYHKIKIDENKLRLQRLRKRGLR